MLATLVSAVGVGLVVFRAWPQVLRIVVHGKTSGVSGLTWTLMLTSNAMWAVVAVQADLKMLLLGNVCAGVGAAAVLVALARHGEVSYLRPAWVVTVTTFMSIAIYAFIGENVLATCISGLTMVMVLPQVVKAFRFDPSGISPITWWFSIGSSIVWTAYKMLMDKWNLVPPNGIVLLAAALILLRVYSYRPAVQVATDPV